MDKELKDETNTIYATKKIEAVGRKAMLEKMLIDKKAEHLAEIESIWKNIIYYETQILYAEKYIAKLSMETASVKTGP